jgi:uncharacterized damage-inducible protein DinB
VDTDSLLALVRFHAWANDRILTTTAGLSDEEFRKTANLHHGSAFRTLRHLVDVDWSWREICVGNDVGDTYVWDRGFALDDLPAIHAFCLEEDARLRSHVESLDDAALTGSPRRARTAVAERRVRATFAEQIPPTSPPAR